MNDLLSGRRLTFSQTIRLLWHLPTLLRTLFGLLYDPSVQVVNKALFLGALAFIISPLDVPNFVPVLGELSDVLLALLACRWFINSCPVEVVLAHAGSLNRKGAAAVPKNPPARVIDLRP